MKPRFKITQAVIFAGGRGERLRPLTDDRPKPMILINGRPFLEYLVSLLKENGIKEIVLLLGYLPEKIIDHFGDGSRFGVRIKYHVGAVSDLTGARIRNAAPVLADRFLLLYSDNYWPIRLDQMTSLFESRNVLVSTTVYLNRDGAAEYGPENNIVVAENGLVSRYDKSRSGRDLNGVDIGFFIVNREILRYMPAENFSFEREILPRLAASGRLAAYSTNHPYYWLTDVSSIARLERFFIPKKVIFLDRDGVINKKMPPHQFVRSWSEFEFLDGAPEAIALLSQGGYKIFVVTNQRGVAGNIVSRQAVDDIHARMIGELSRRGALIAGVYVCPHDFKDGCFCRKPFPGLFFEAARDHRLDLTKAVVVGDSESDLIAGEAAGCRSFLVQDDRSLLDIVRTLP